MPVSTTLGATSTDMTTLLGSALDDLFSTETSKLFIKGLEGNDRVQVDSAVEQLEIELDEDNDRIVFNAEVLSSTLRLGLGNDEVVLGDFSGSIYGGTGKVDNPNMDEPGYILQPPCLWGDAKFGLEAPPDVTGRTLHTVKTSKADYGHHGEMAWQQMYFF